VLPHHPTPAPLPPLWLGWSEFESEERLEKELIQSEDRLPERGDGVVRPRKRRG